MTAESDKRMNMTDEEYDNFTNELVDMYLSDADKLEQDPSSENIKLAIDSIRRLSYMVLTLHNSMEKIRKLHKVT